MGLEAAKSRQYQTAAAPLEGFVIREAGGGHRIAKARVEHLLAQPAKRQGSSLVETTARCPDASARGDPDEVLERRSAARRPCSAFHEHLDLAHLRWVGLP